MSSSRGFVVLFACLGLGSACEVDSGPGGEDEVFDGAGEASENTKAAALPNAQVRLVAAADGLDAMRFRAVAATSAPKYEPASVIWDEDDAKLLLALVLKGMCSVVSDCDSWLWDALEMGPEGSVMLSKDGSARLAERAAALRSDGQGARALQVEEWETNAASDLESVSSIGISAEAARAVLAGLAGPTAEVASNLQFSELLTFRASAASALALDSSRAFLGVLPANALVANVAIPLDRAGTWSVSTSASGLSSGADAYVLALYAQVRGTSVAALAAACPTQQSGPIDLTAHDKAVTLGAVECARGGGALDTALDTSCENVIPGKTYCVNEKPEHEWATGHSAHQMNVAFAASARRCEPCQDGYGMGTLRLIRNARNQAMTMCDTSPSCNPSANPQVPGCSCMN
jgi:hypothetical protein